LSSKAKYSSKILYPFLRGLSTDMSGKPLPLFLLAKEAQKKKLGKKKSAV
jgi:hypothetical protein